MKIPPINEEREVFCMIIDLIPPKFSDIELFDFIIDSTEWLIDFNNLDLLFIMDLTGSMEQFVDQEKQN